LQRVKNQHYVPQFCLKRFTADGSTVYVFDKPNMQVFPSDVRNIASENGFYYLSPKLATDVHAMDKALQMLEEYAAPAFVHLLTDLEQKRAFNHRDEKLRRAIATFIVIQDVRTRLFRDQYVRKHDMVLKEIERRSGIKPPGGAEQISPERIAFEHARFMFRKEYRLQAVAALMNHIWVVGRNDTRQPLYFSDAPVTRYPHVNNPFLGTGLMTKGVEINFPLSSRYLLMICERTTFAEKYANHEGRMTALEDENVKFYNGLQIWNCRRQIYCSQDKFDLVKRYAAKDPEIFDVDRERFEIV
jgi:hypothetical protein